MPESVLNALREDRAITLHLTSASLPNQHGPQLSPAEAATAAAAAAADHDQSPKGTKQNSAPGPDLLNRGFNADILAPAQFMWQDNDPCKHKPSDLQAAYCAKLCPLDGMAPEGNPSRPAIWRYNSGQQVAEALARMAPPHPACSSAPLQDIKNNLCVSTRVQLKAHSAPSALHLQQQQQQNENGTFDMAEGSPSGSSCAASTCCYALPLSSLHLPHKGLCTVHSPHSFKNSASSSWPTAPPFKPGQIRMPDGYGQAATTTTDPTTILHQEVAGLACSVPNYGPGRKCASMPNPVAAPRDDVRKKRNSRKFGLQAAVCLQNGGFPKSKRVKL